MMALPYITEHTGFTGTVYATEPTLQIGRSGDPIFIFFKLLSACFGSAKSHSPSGKATVLSDKSEISSTCCYFPDC